MTEPLREVQPVRTFCGIDPGRLGGLALIRSNGRVSAFEMPETERELRQLFASRIVPERVEFCLLERVHAIQHPRNEQGEITGQVSTSRMFNFGRGVGVLVGLLLAYEIPFEEMDPKTWQKALGIPPRVRNRKGGRGPLLQPAPIAETQSEWKNRLRARAQQMFPGMPKLTSGQADALLMATIAQRIKAGFLGNAAR